MYAFFVRSTMLYSVSKCYYLVYKIRDSKQRSIKMCASIAYLFGSNLDVF
jgi:hypothetical protein